METMTDLQPITYRHIGSRPCAPAGRVYIVLEYVPHTLSQRMRESWKTGVKHEDAKTVLYQLIKAVKFLHSARVRMHGVPDTDHL